LNRTPTCARLPPFTEGETDVNEIINLLEKENLTDALLEDGHFLGTILGYGPGNALNFAKLYDEDTLDHERAELDASSVAPARRFADELWALKEAADSGNYPRNAVRAFLEGVFDTDNPKM
jgi:hypothetical protein